MRMSRAMTQSRAGSSVSHHVTYAVPHVVHHTVGKIGQSGSTG